MWKNLRGIIYILESNMFSVIFSKVVFLQFKKAVSQNLRHFFVKVQGFEDISSFSWRFSYIFISISKFFVEGLSDKWSIEANIDISVLDFKNFKKFCLLIRIFYSSVSNDSAEKKLELSLGISLRNRSQIRKSFLPINQRPRWVS